jgi:hypothetical protein
MGTPSPQDIRAAREQLLAQWAGSPSRARRIAAAWGRELLDRAPHEMAESSMRIAKRHEADNSMAARARRFLLGARILYRNPQNSRYYIAAPILPPAMRPYAVAQGKPPPAAAQRPPVTRA